MGKRVETDCYINLSALQLLRAEGVLTSHQFRSLRGMEMKRINSEEVCGFLRKHGQFYNAGTNAGDDLEFVIGYELK